MRILDLSEEGAVVVAPEVQGMHLIRFTDEIGDPDGSELSAQLRRKTAECKWRSAAHQKARERIRELEKEIFGLKNRIFRAENLRLWPQILPAQFVDACEIDCNQQACMDVEGLAYRFRVRHIPSGMVSPAFIIASRDPDRLRAQSAFTCCQAMAELWRKHSEDPQDHR